jgi:LemA protein
MSNVQNKVGFFNRYKMAIFIVGGVIVTFLCLYLISLGIKSQALRLENYVETAAADITVVEKERTDKLNTLFPTVKATAKHEKDVIDSIAAARQNISSNLEEGNLGAVQSEFETVNKSISIIVENYPQIAATEAYMEFMSASAIAESKISSHRTNYNAAVRSYNDFTVSPFNNMFFALSGYKVKTLELLDFGTQYQDPTEYNWEE